MGKFASDFWFDSQDDVSYTSSSYSLIRMASFRRAVANFVTIVTGESIPVYYNTRDHSFTDGEAVVLSAHIPNSQIDASVGLALHEAVHIVRRDCNDWLANLPSHIPSSVYDKATAKAELGLDRKKVAARIKRLLNWVRDRSNDMWYYKQAPGYRPYYDALYKKYFYRPVIDVALRSSKFRTPSWKGYNFRIVNLHNKNRDLDALPGLRDIWEMLDLKTIDRLETIQETLPLVLDIWDVVITNLIDPSKVKRPNSQNSGDSMSDAEMDELDEKLLEEMMEQQNQFGEEDEDMEMPNSDEKGMNLPDDTEYDDDDEDQTPPQNNDDDEDQTPHQNNDDDDDQTGDSDMVDIDPADGDEKESDSNETDGDNSNESDDQNDDTDSDEIDENSTGNESDDESDKTDSNGRNEEDGIDTKDADEDGSEGQNTDNEDDSEQNESISDDKNDNENNSSFNGDETDDTEPDDLTDDEENQLKKAMNTQDDFLDNGVEKKELDKDQNATLKQMEKSGASVEKTGKEFGGVKTVVIRKLNSDLLNDLPIGNVHAIPMSDEGVLTGIRYGKMLAEKLQVRNETTVTEFNRKRTGKLDRRRVHAVSYADTICKQIFYDEYGEALIHISIDASSSMHSNAKWTKTMATAVAIAKATDSIDKLDVIISFRCTTVLDNGESAPLVVIAYDSRFDKFVKIRQLFPRIYPNGWTPEGLAYEAIMNEILQSVAGKEGYFINFSDGEPYFGSYSGSRAHTHTAKQVRKMLSRGIKVLSFFIEGGYYGSCSTGFKKMYGKNSSFIDVNQILSVAKEMNKKLLAK